MTGLPPPALLAWVVGGYRSGKTSYLRSLAEQFDRPLVVCASVAAASAFGLGARTWWDVAREVLDDDVPIPSTAEHVARFGGDAPLAEAVCHYHASFLGLEELRTHADAAGCLDQWEAVAAAAEGDVNWAGVLVAASLKLRDEAVLGHWRSQFDVVLVDDFESASFATNRLLSQLAGFGGPVAVAGNPDNAVWRHIAGSPSFLTRFPKRFGAVTEVDLSARQRREHDGGPQPPLLGGAAYRRDPLATPEFPVELLVGSGGDPWLPLPSDGPIPVALASSLSWPSVAIALGDEPAPSPYDLDVLGGPDVPTDDSRAERRRREHEARWALARSRGTWTT